MPGWATCRIGYAYAVLWDFGWSFMSFWVAMADREIPGLGCRLIYNPTYQSILMGLDWCARIRWLGFSRADEYERARVGVMQSPTANSCRGVTEGIPTPRLGIAQGSKWDILQFLCLEVQDPGPDVGRRHSKHQQNPLTNLEHGCSSPRQLDIHFT
jgi:hypothetical protein